VVQEKRSLMDLIWRKKENWNIILRGESLLREVIEKRPRRKKPIGYAK